MTALLAISVPGSMEIVADAPMVGATPPGWARVCSATDVAPADQVAYCSRVTGRVIGSQGKQSGETHLLVTGGLHVTVVELPLGRRAPGWGSWVTAVGPLFTGSGGIPELRAVEVSR
jgi:hypothetical protein